MVWAPLLVPLDGSPVAEAALPYADAIAKAMGAPVRLLSVIEVEPDGLPGRPPHVRSALEQLERQAEEYLAITATTLRAWGLTVSTTLRQGRPAVAILAVADEDDVAMTVMATHGRGGAERWLVGSVADKVMRLSARPTLLIRPPTPGSPERSVALRRLLAPLDGSSLAEEALTLAVELAVAADATLILVRVEPWRPTLVGPTDYPKAIADLNRLEEKAAAAAAAYLEDVQRRLHPQPRVETVVLRGAPAAELADFALREGVDLTVMSTHGRGGLRRLVLGSTADRMVRAGAPVLLIRPAGTSETAGEPE